MNQNNDFLKLTDNPLYNMQLLDYHLENCEIRMSILNEKFREQNFLFLVQTSYYNYKKIFGIEGGPIF